MKLDTPHRKFQVLDGHDLTLGSVSYHLKGIWNRIWINDEGMIARSGKGGIQPFEDLITAVVYHGCFAMHEIGCLHNAAAKALTNTLVSEADS